MGVLLAVAIMAGAIIVGGAGAAQACSCQSLPADVDVDASYGESADAVFVGVATDESLDPPPERQEGLPGTVRFVFDVELVAKGEVADPVEVSTSANSGSCGTDFVLGQRYKVFASRRDDGSLDTGLCSGNRLATEDDLVAVPPTSAITTTTAPTPDGALPVTGQASRDTAGATLALILFGGAFVLAARAAPRAAPPRRLG